MLNVSNLNYYVIIAFISTVHLNKKMKYNNIAVKFGNRYAGWLEYATYNTIIVTAAIFMYLSETIYIIK